MRNQDLAPTIRHKLKFTDQVLVLPSLPEHDHGEGIEFAICKEGGA
jgi:hypothetical protein